MSCRQCHRFFNCLNHDRCDENGELYEWEVCPEESLTMPDALKEVLKTRREEQKLRVAHDHTSKHASEAL